MDYEVFDNLEKGYERKAIELPDIRVEPWMNKLLEDPRWISLESRMGLRNL